MAEESPQPTESTPDTGNKESAPTPIADAQFSPTEVATEEGGFLKQEDLDALFAAASADSGSEVSGSAVFKNLNSAGATGLDDSAGTDSSSASGASDAVRETTETSLNLQQFQYPDFGTAAVAGVDTKRVTMLSDVNLRVKIELGRTRMLVEEVLKLGEGSVVELEKLAGDPVDVYANDRLVARGEVLVLDDSFCVRINEVVSRDPHRITR